jgi:periplasmic copper chaperone A
MGRYLLSGVCLICLVLGACAGNGAVTGSSAIQINDPWVKAIGGMVMPGMGAPTPEPTRPSDAQRKAPIDTALYLTIRSTGTAADRLVGASTSVATRAELHTVEKKGNDMVMYQVPAVDVPAGGEVQLKPGSFHVMLFGLTRDLKEGDTVDVSLQFEKAGTVPVRAVVRKP